MHYASLCDDHPCTEIFVHASGHSFGNRFLESVRMPLLKAPDNTLPGCCPESGVGRGVPSCPHLYPTLALSAALQTGQPAWCLQAEPSSQHACACLAAWPRAFLCPASFLFYLFGNLKCRKFFRGEFKNHTPLQHQAFFFYPHLILKKNFLGAPG